MLCGDFNLNPEFLAEHAIFRRLHAVVARTALPTCNANCYDYFVVPDKWCGVVVGAYRIRGAYGEPPVAALLAR